MVKEQSVAIDTKHCRWREKISENSNWWTRFWSTQVKTPILGHLQRLQMLSMRRIKFVIRTVRWDDQKNVGYMSAKGDEDKIVTIDYWHRTWKRLTIHFYTTLIYTEPLSIFDLILLCYGLHFVAIPDFQSLNYLKTHYCYFCSSISIYLYRIFFVAAFRRMTAWTQITCDAVDQDSSFMWVIPLE